MTPFTPKFSQLKVHHDPQKNSVIFMLVFKMSQNSVAFVTKEKQTKLS